MSFKKPKERVFVVDGNWYLWRAFYTLNTNRPIEEALPYHLLSMICKDALAVRAKYLLVAFDGPKVFRYKVYPKYKESRNEKKAAGADSENAVAKDVYAYMPDILGYLDEAGVTYYQPRTFEADDVICSVVHALVPRGYRVIGGCHDKDGFQWLSDDALMYDSSHKNKHTKKQEPRYITAEMAEKMKGVTVAQMVDFQTLIGDKGDDIPPVHGFSPKMVGDGLREHGSLVAWYRAARGDEKINMIAHKEDMRRNRKLVELSKEAVPPTEVEEWRLPKKKPGQLSLPRSYHDLHLFMHPKTKGLFG